MSAKFDATELVRVAIIEERNGVSFYSTLAEKAADAGLRASFAKMAEQEKVHEKRFQDMFDGLESTGQAGGYPDEYVSYLETLVTTGASTGKSAGRKAQDFADDMEAIDIAIGLERDQLILMQDMADILGSAHRDVIDAIIKEEQGHVVELAAAKRRLQDG